MFIPLKDDNPTSTFPFVTITIIAANVLFFFYQLSLGPELKAFIFKLGVIPYEITHFTDLPPLNDLPIVTNFFTSIFMHGGFMHLIGNMWSLWIFGDNIEDTLGHFKYILFYLVCGFVATITHIFFNFSSPVPVIGASGAIAGVMGAYILLFPHARVQTLLFIFIFIRIIPVPAVIVIGFWIFLQVISGMQTIGITQSTGVAWFAHIGGFAAGILFIYLFGNKKIKLRRKYYNRCN